MTEILHLLPDGASVAAVLVVVMLFLKQQDKSNRLLQTLTNAFSEQIADNHARWHDQVHKITNQSCENQKHYQDQIQSLVEAHINVSRETIMAIRTLETTLRSSRERVPPH